MSNFILLSRAYSKMINEQNEVEEQQNSEESPKEKEETVEKEDVEMRLSENLAIELANTLNSFTAICDKVVKKKYATAETLDRLENIYSKIKDLISAGKNSVNK